jgi:hypothetical protein
MTPSDFNFAVGFRVAPATVMHEMLLAARSWADVPIRTASDLSVFNNSSFSANYAFTTCEQDSSFTSKWAWPDVLLFSYNPSVHLYIGSIYDSGNELMYSPSGITTWPI